MKRMTEAHLFTTLTEAYQWVLKNRTEGCICPCCGQIAKVYKRKINSGMARELIRLYKLGEGWHHQTKFASVTSGEISKLEYWGLVESKKNNDTKKRCSGYWCLTNAGQMFIENKSTPFKHVYLYDGKFIGFSPEKTNIIESLGNKFDYQELMQSK